jgi:Metallo-peptidase family M12B Reprolysin-like
MNTIRSCFTVIALICMFVTSAHAAMVTSNANAAGEHHKQCMPLHQLPSESVARHVYAPLLARNAEIAASTGPDLKYSQTTTLNTKSFVPPRWAPDMDKLIADGKANKTTWATVDVLIYIRDSYRAEFGDETEKRVRTVFGYANQYFAQSGVKIQFRVVGFKSYPYHPTASYNGHRILDVEADARNRVETGADLALDFASTREPDNFVCPGRIGSCGTGSASVATYQKISPLTQEFATVYEAKGAYVEAVATTIAHEFGHNMGLDHPANTDEAEPGPRLYEYSGGWSLLGKSDFGYRTETNRYINGWYSDIMGYGMGQVFSSPDVSAPNGLALGDRQRGDATRSLNETRFAFAQLWPQVQKYDDDYSGLWWNQAYNGLVCVRHRRRADVAIGKTGSRQ